MKLTKGQKAALAPGGATEAVSFRFGWKAGTHVGVDASAFLLSEGNRCERDEDFIFYGNPGDGGAVSHRKLADGEAIDIRLAKLPERVARIALTLTVYEGEKLGHAMKDVSGPYVSAVDAGSGAELHRFEFGGELARETAVVVGELYRYKGEWRFSAIGSGFFGGLAALCTHYGLELADDEAGGEAAAEVAAASARDAAAAPVSAVTAGMPTIDLRKRTVQITLEKKRLTGVRARVGIVLDISGSMVKLYRNGTVQQIVERILAVACQFDDNGTLDVWIYDNEFSRLPSVTERDFEGYVTRQIMNNGSIHKFGRNDEPRVMEDVIRKYTAEESDTTPVFVIFINDGGVVRATRKVIISSAVQPIFWQFVGIGHSDFEVLQSLDTMKGRVVDNAGFIHIDRIDEVSDETLYDRLLNEFPQWLREAKAKRIVP